MPPVICIYRTSVLQSRPLPELLSCSQLPTHIHPWGHFLPFHHHWCFGVSWRLASGWFLSLQIPPSSCSSLASIWWPTRSPSLVIQVLRVPQLLPSACLARTSGAKTALLPNGGCCSVNRACATYPAVPAASAALYSHCPSCRLALWSYIKMSQQTKEQRLVWAQWFIPDHQAWA